MITTDEVNPRKKTLVVRGLDDTQQCKNNAYLLLVARGRQIQRFADDERASSSANEVVRRPRAVLQGAMSYCLHRVVCM